MLAISQNEVFLNYTRAKLLQDLHEDDANVLSMPEIDHHLGDASLLALATIFFGTEHQDTAVVQRGLQKYNGVIQEINSALGDNVRYQSCDVFDAIVTMVLLEVSPCHYQLCWKNASILNFLLQFHISERDRGWFHHACGLERLMDLRGPTSFMSLPDLIVLEQARLPVLFAALTLRQPTILANPEWKHVPWTHFPERKTYKEKLFDIFADCPALLAASTALASNTSESSAFSKHQELVVAIRQVSDDLDEFERAWTFASMAYIWEVPSPRLTPPIINTQGDTVTLWSTVLYYQSLGHSHIAMMGSAIRILLLIIYRDIGYSASDISPAEVSHQIMIASMTICRSIDYQFQEIKKGASSHSVFYPIKIALKGVYDDHPALGNWLKGILDQLSAGFVGKWNITGINPR